MTTISLDAAVNAVLGDEATARHWAVLGKQCRDPDARVARCREARALLREQRVSQGDNVKALCELRPSGATLWRWVQLAETAHAQLLAKRARGDDEARRCFKRHEAIGKFAVFWAPPSRLNIS